MKSVGDILDAKGDQQVFSITPETIIQEAVQLMAEKSVGSLVVLIDGRLVGIMTERDYTRKVMLKGLSSKTARVGEIMSTTLITVDRKETMHRCMELMTNKRIRHLPVLEEGRVVGMLSIGDLMKHTIEDQQEMIAKLEKYIRGEIS